jgi:hypothetical protein
MHTESSSTYDKTYVSIIEGNKTSVVLQKISLFDALQKWKHVKYDMKAFKGKTIKIQFKFDTIDTLYNSTEGVYVDNLQITDPCE